MSPMHDVVLALFCSWNHALLALNVSLGWLSRDLTLDCWRRVEFDLMRLNTRDLMLLARDGIECPPLNKVPKVGRQAAMMEEHGSISPQMIKFIDTSRHFNQRRAKY